MVENGELTVLDELESVDDVALVCGEKETAAVDCLAGRVLGRGDFGAELDAAADDTAVRGGCFDWWVFEIGSGVGLTGMCCERASVLGCLIVREVVTEIVVLFLVTRDSIVVSCGCEIDGCSCA